MTFDPAIPAGTDNLSTSQGQIQTNFSQLNTIFGYDHFAWNDSTVANRGFHKKITLPTVLSADPTPAGTESELYTKKNGAVGDLYYANSTTVTQLTGGATSLGTNGYVTFPGGMIMQWGQSNFTTTGTSKTVTFPIAFPTASYNVQVTLIAFGNSGTAHANTTTDFIASRDSGAHSGQQFWWVAIGK